MTNYSSTPSASGSSKTQRTEAQNALRENANALLTLKMIAVLALGAVLGAPAVGYFLWEVKQLSWLSGAEKYSPAIPANPPAKAKDFAFYCADGVQKRYLGCN
jgi:hypothetical protein